MQNTSPYFAELLKGMRTITNKQIHLCHALSKGNQRTDTKMLNFMNIASPFSNIGGVYLL